MKKTSRSLIACGLAAFMIISWIVAASSKTPMRRQAELLSEAQVYIESGVYILAVPLLEEAASLNTANTVQVEAELKRVYRELSGMRSYRRKYISLLEIQMSRTYASADVFEEAANYYLGISKLPQALDILKDGIRRTECARLTEIYEENRYAFEWGRAVYDYASAIYNGTSSVMRDGYWGIARADGVLIIPCQYEKVSTFSGGRAVVRKNNEIYTVNADNNRVALLKTPAFDFGNLSHNRIPLKFETGWHRATWQFEIGAMAFEEIGMYQNGHAAAKTGGNWGVIDISANWLLPPEFCGIIQDELGGSFRQNAVFAKLNGWVYLFADGMWIDDYFEDAKPFSAQGYAAVRKNGKWGFIDSDGNLKIDYIFDDALSFGGHLAAVKQNDMWGYINPDGKVVIDTIFYEAKSFSGGSATVLTERGWQFITLIEFKKGVTL